MTTPVDTVRRFYDALGRGDVPSVLSLLDAQVEWTEAERFPYYGGTWRGPQAVLDNLLKPRSARRDAWPGASRSRCSARLAGRVARSPAQMSFGPLPCRFAVLRSSIGQERREDVDGACWCLAA